MKQEGHTVLLTTHYIDEAEELCDRIAIIDQGRIIATGAPHDLVARSAATQSVSLVTAEPLDPALLSGLSGVEDLTYDGVRARFTTSNAGATVAELMGLLDRQHADLVELQVRKATLEDVFIGLTGTSLRD
jgi:ABC-2 type transport system ATP-binding protein